jgi:hypothetical protein
MNVVYGEILELWTLILASNPYLAVFDSRTDALPATLGIVQATELASIHLHAAQCELFQ